MFCVIEFSTRIGLRLFEVDIARYRPVAENVVRDLSVEKKPLYLPHPFLPYVMNPNVQHTQIIKYPLRDEPILLNRTINSFGMRSPEISFEKPPGTYRILCFGGSTTMGSVADDKTWPYLIEKKLNEKEIGKKVEVLNFGVGGYRTSDSLINFALRGLDFDPDLIIIYHGTNDKGLYGAKDFKSDYSHAIKDLPEFKYGVQDYIPGIFFHSQFITLLTGVIDRKIIGRHTNLHVATGIPFENDPKDLYKGKETFKRNIRSIIGIAKAHNVSVMLSTHHTYGTGQLMDMLNQDIRDLSKSENVSYVDQDRLIPHYDNTYHIDGCHFSESGTDLMAENFVNKILETNLIQS